MTERASQYCELCDPPSPMHYIETRTIPMDLGPAIHESQMERLELWRCPQNHEALFPEDGQTDH